MTEVEFLKSLSVDYTVPPEKLVRRPNPIRNTVWDGVYSGVVDAVLGTEEAAQIARCNIPFGHRAWLRQPRWVDNSSDIAHLVVSIENINNSYPRNYVYAECGSLDVPPYIDRRYTGVSHEPQCQRCLVESHNWQARGVNAPTGRDEEAW